MTDVSKPGDSRFFARTGPHALVDIAKLAGAHVEGAERMIAGVAPLQSAGQDDVSFLDNRRYADLLSATKAGAVIVHPDFAEQVPAGCAAIVTNEPYVAWARVSALFHPFPVAAAGVHPSAIVDPSAVIDAGAEIGPGAVIGARAEIGAGSIVGPLAVIGVGVVIGKHCRIHAHVTVSHAVIGDRVILFPGARIGQDGFGFAIGATGFTPVPQLGRVVIGDGAEIGANACIDRGSAQDTVIGPGVHVDNLVQLAHNVTVGAGSVIVAQVGISGSTAIGRHVMIAGQAGLVGHLTVGDGAQIGAQSGVMNDVPAGAKFFGYPAQSAKAYFRELAQLRKLAKAARKPDKGAERD
jgi:UDP-3-O-[3-hydroxymyristoyl] glucosamine N-acyltransferase